MTHNDQQYSQNDPRTLEIFLNGQVHHVHYEKMDQIHQIES